MEKPRSTDARFARRLAPSLEVVRQEADRHRQDVRAQEVREPQGRAAMEADEAPDDLDGIGALAYIEGHDEEGVGLARVGGEEAEGHGEVRHLEWIEGVECPIEAAGYAAQRRRGKPG